jgi:putative membrane protein
MASEQTVPEKLDRNTLLAADRTRLAYERTLMAWVRTSTSLIAFGFTIYQVFNYLEDQPDVRPPVVQPGVVGIVMMVTALVVLALAVFQHRQGLRALHAEYGPMPTSIATLVAMAIAVLGVVALLAVVLRT